MLSSIASMDVNSCDKESAFIKIFEKLIIKMMLAHHQVHV